MTCVILETHVQYVTTIISTVRSSLGNVMYVLTHSSCVLFNHIRDKHVIVIHMYYTLFCCACDTGCPCTRIVILKTDDCVDLLRY